MPTDDQALLPEGFRFGVATAGFGVEGGFNRPGEPANNWSWWERSGRAAPSGVAGDFWRSPEPVLDRAASLGCDTFGLSIEWARIEPEEGAVDTSALDHYASILAACVERGLQPVVTLHHFTHPIWLGEEFWLTPGSPDRFADHVARVVPTLSAHCCDWVTINEPNVLALSGWMLGTFPPGRYLAAADALAVADNLLAAHVLAYAAIRAAQPEATVTVNPAACSAYDLDRLMTDLVAARSMGIAADRVDEWVDERRALHDALFPPATPGERVLRGVLAAASHYGTAAPVPGLGRAGTWARDRLRRPSPERALDLVYESAHERTLDVVGFDWYDPTVSRSPRLRRHRTAGGPSWEASRSSWDDRPDPEAMGRWCADQSALYPGVPLWILGNGMSTRATPATSLARSDGGDRSRYLRTHLSALTDAAAAGAPVRAYLHRSIMDGYEWGSYEPCFGLFGVDRSSADRVRWLATDAAGVDAAGTYRRLIAGLRAGDRSVLAD